MVMEVMHGDTAACANHPFRNTTTPDRGGICAFCLREKLRNLISSSFPEAAFPSSSSSSSPISRSDVVVLQSQSSSTYKDIAKLPAHHHHQKVTMNNQVAGIMVSDSTQHVLDEHCTSKNSRRRGFWSFLQYRRTKVSGFHKDVNFTQSTINRGSRNRGAADEEEDNDDQASPDPRISRSRSMGCGRNFSGDLFDTLSTGFGGWSLRRVASQREEKQQQKGPNRIHENGSTPTDGRESIKERVVQGGISSGSTMTPSSSSSHRVAPSLQGRRKSISYVGKITTHSHSWSKSWGWASASPLRASARPPSRKKEASSSNKSSTPSLSL